MLAGKTVDEGAISGCIDVAHDAMNGALAISATLVKIRIVAPRD